MNSLHVGTALVLGVISLATSPLVLARRQPPASTPAPGWIGNLDEAKAAARQSGKPILLVFR